jgi:DNA-directed RNA polymerase specialized sigma24 family protein
MVELTQTYSKNYLIVAKYIKEYHTTTVNTDVDPSVTDSSYNPDSVIKTITQKQKTLSEAETRTIITKYQQGKSTYELAKEFGCHRATISRALKDNGIEVTNQCAKKKVLAEMIMQMYSEWYKPQEIGEALGVSADTVRRILHDNNVYIRKSWEYPKK